MKITNLKMDASWTGHVSVSWQDEKQNSYTAPLRTDNGEPVLPYQVKDHKPIGHKVSKRYVFKARPGETRRTRIDSEAMAHSRMVNEALKQAEEQNLYPAAVERVAARQAEREKAEQAEQIAKVRDKLKPLLDHENEAIKQRALIIYHAPDDAILILAGALR